MEFIRRASRVYTTAMSFDFIVMIVSIAGLLRCRGRSNLWTLLLRQGVGYFVAAFTANLVTTVRGLWI